ncbi:ankyrin repeat-containing domain protein [Phyllosticta paracitricarpa]
MVQVLLENGAHVNNLRNKKQRTPLQLAVDLSPYMAAKREHPKIVRLLLEHGADVSVRDWLLMTPLHVAAARGDVEVVEILLADGADVDARDAQGLTARGSAEKCGRKRVLECLPESDGSPWDQEAQRRYDICDASSEPDLEGDRKMGFRNFEEEIAEFFVKYSQFECTKP